MTAANAMMPQPGKVSTQVNTISFTTEKLTAERRFAAPTPMTAVVLVCVVEMGSPVRFDMRMQMLAANVAVKPSHFSIFTMFIPTLSSERSKKKLLS